MSDEWVVLELSPKSEGEDPEVVRGALLHALKEGDIFIPAAVTQVGDDRAVHYLLDGYAFVRRTHPDAAYLKLVGSRFVQSVLLKPNHKTQRVLATVNSSHIQKLRGQIDAEVNQGIGVGDTVLIMSGHYKHIEATVIEEIPEQDAVQVFIKLRSKQSIITLPRSFLKVVSRSPLSPLIARLSLLRAWVQSVTPVFRWDSKAFLQVQRQVKEVQRLDRWITSRDPLIRFWRFTRASDPRVYLAQVGEVEQLTSWVRRYSKINNRIARSYLVTRDDSLVSLESQVLELLWFNDALARGRQIRSEMNEILRRLATKKVSEGKMQNVIVDGHNLAFRCLYAPGMKDLSDTHGRPTGVILGFVRSLGALRKRFPEATLWVAWDGSSRRRKAIFADYKANRSQSNRTPIFDQIGYLRETLPLLGAIQVFNPDEEADDVIASLVRNKVSQQKSVIFGTDRDFLQLVNNNISVLIPAIGSRKEMLMGPLEVEKQFGVQPKTMLELRSLIGDPSDNIPGVPRVPKKVLKSLVQAHGSVDGIYRSGLAGLSRVQYDRIRSAEPQVRINLDLMTLVDVSFTTIDPQPNPDSLAKRLDEVDIQPSNILETFFGRSSEFAAGTLSL